MSVMTTRSGDKLANKLNFIFVVVTKNKMAEKEIARAAERAVKHKNLKLQFEQFDTMWQGKESLNKDINVANVVNTLLYWYFRKVLNKATDFRNLRNDIFVLRQNWLITPSKERALLDIVDDSEDSLWSTIISIVNNNKYKTVSGDERVIKTVDDASNALFAADDIIRRLRQHLDITIKALMTDVVARDRMCADEYKTSQQCESTACEIYKPFFSSASAATCRSKR